MQSIGEGLENASVHLLRRRIRTDHPRPLHVLWRENGDSAQISMLKAILLALETTLLLLLMRSVHTRNNDAPLLVLTVDRDMLMTREPVLRACMI